MVSKLESLRSMTTVVSDTGDMESIKQFKPLPRLLSTGGLSPVINERAICTPLPARYKNIPAFSPCSRQSITVNPSERPGTSTFLWWHGISIITQVGPNWRVRFFSITSLWAFAVRSFLGTFRF